MGAKVSRKLLAKEKQTWGKEKNTLYRNTLGGQPQANQNLRDMIALLNYFEKKLYLCYMEHEYSTNTTTLKYQHWFVTDKKWYIEFGDGSKESFYKCSVTVHCDKKPEDTYYVTREFEKTKDVYGRMVNVLGADNFSLIFRNAEHVARYIHCGSWISMQTGRNGRLSTPFIKKMKEDEKQMMNTRPHELVKEKKEIVPLYPDESNRKRFLSHLHQHFQRRTLSSADDDLYNIVFLGPTGSGKSTLINLLFNATINVAASGASSVTRDITFAQGIAQFNTYWPSGERSSNKNQNGNENDGSPIKISGKDSITSKCSNVIISKATKSSKYVNVIDTVGFCDSKMSETEVITYVKDKLKDNLMHIDKVVFVCSGRLEKTHQDSITQFMKWLKYDSFKRNFAFVYNKCDGMDEGRRLENLSDVCSMLGVDTTVTNSNGSSELKNPIPMVNALGFRPKAPFEEIDDDLRKLCDSVIIPTYNEADKEYQRIPISKQSCSIL